LSAKEAQQYIILQRNILSTNAPQITLQFICMVNSKQHRKILEIDAEILMIYGTYSIPHSKLHFSEGKAG
jgi:hypothetical protein